MKIAFVCQDLIGGGVQYATAAMVRSFSALGYEVDLLLSKVHFDRQDEGDRPFEVPSKVNVLRMPSRRGRGNILYLRRYLRNTDAEYVIAESGIYADCLRLASFCLKCRPKLVHVWHGDTPKLKKSFIPRLRQKLYYNFLYSRYYAVFTVNAHIREGIIEITHAISPDRIFVVYNPVVDDIFREKVKGPTTHPWLRNKKCPTFVAAGACDWNKGHLMLIKAVEEANRILSRGNAVRADRIRLVVFGTGVKEEEFRQYVASRKLEDFVSLAGFCDNLPAELKLADGFVLGTHVESFAIVLVEALACGIPVISTDAPWGPVEVLENGKYGTLVPVEDVVGMANAMLKVAFGEKQSVPNQAWSRFTIENITERYLKGLGLSWLYLDSK